VKAARKKQTPKSAAQLLDGTASAAVEADDAISAPGNTTGFTTLVMHEALAAVGQAGCQHPSNP